MTTPMPLPWRRRSSGSWTQLGLDILATNRLTSITDIEPEKKEDLPALTA